MQNIYTLDKLLDNYNSDEIFEIIKTEDLSKNVNLPSYIIEYYISRPYQNNHIAICKILYKLLTEYKFDINTYVFRIITLANNSDRDSDRNSDRNFEDYLNIIKKVLEESDTLQDDILLELLVLFNHDILDILWYKGVKITEEKISRVIKVFNHAKAWYVASGNNVNNKGVIQGSKYIHYLQNINDVKKIVYLTQSPFFNKDIIRLVKCALYNEEDYVNLI